MAFNNYYGGYNPYQTPAMGFGGAAPDNLSQLRGMQMPTPPAMSGAVWVQGENAAKSYPVAPSNNVILMDSESTRFYVKSADTNGMPMPLRIFEYKEISGAAVPAEQDMSKFVTKEELSSILSRYALSANSNEEVTSNV